MLAKQKDKQKLELLLMTKIYILDLRFTIAVLRLLKD